MSTADADSKPDPINAAPRTRSPVGTAAVGYGAQAVREKPIGYAALFAELGITSYTLTRQTVVAQNARSTGAREEVDAGGRVRTILPGRTAYQEGIAGQLFAALRHDGVDLEALRLIFAQIHTQDLTTAIRESPISAPSRQAWFLYEWITGTTLDIPGGIRTKYIPLLDPERYVTCEQGRSSRHGIILNALGSPQLCPTIRRTLAWEAAIATDPLGQRDRLAATLDPVTEDRINSFLVTRESRSSFAIEGERTTVKDDQLFYALLKEFTSPGQPPISSAVLHDYHFKLLKGAHAPTDRNFRRAQVWVGDRMGDVPLPSHIAPLSKDVPALMQEFCSLANHLTDQGRANAINPIAVASVTSGLFAYIHPFMDGNGRVGRLLLQQPLTTVSDQRRLFIPISAAINRHRQDYYGALDAWSKPLVHRIPYDQLDGGVVVRGETRDLYRYPDLTRYAEFIATSCSEAVTKDLVEERDIMKTYDLAKDTFAQAGLQEKQARLFFTLALQNQWKLGKKKHRLFPSLTEEGRGALESELQRIAGMTGIANHIEELPPQEGPES